VTDPLRINDLSVFEPRPKRKGGFDEHAWLERLQEHLRASDHVIRLGETQDIEDDFVISRNAQGQWVTGRYIGEIAFEGHRLRIEPRLGPNTIAKWLEGALNLVAVPETSARASRESFIALLMAAVWSRQLDLAARHGPPAFRRDVPSEGFYVRGRLDVRQTARLRSAGSPHVASVLRQRDLDNDVSRTLVAAERVLTAAVGHTRWRTPRVNEVLPMLTAAVGARPQVPSLRDLQRIRYTPITRPFKEAAELSWRIARQEGFGATAEAGQTEGLLLDVAELWELFLVHCVRRAFPNSSVEHGTTSGTRTFLLTSDTAAAGAAGLGRIKPDIVVCNGDELVAVIDAKYKRLANVWPERPAGVARGDLYQLASYLSRLDPSGRAAGMLLYPMDPGQEVPATAEARGLWLMEAGSRVRFVRVPVESAAAVEQLQRLIG
jgi:5-methylcytosine-specific restriction enzyme subunit McrC